MKSIFLIAAAALNCTSSTIISMTMDKEKSMMMINLNEEERRMLAEHEMLVAQENGHPVSYRSMLSLPPSQKEQVHQYNQALAIDRVENVTKHNEQRRKEANRMMQICQQNGYLICNLTIVHLHLTQQAQAHEYNQRLIAQYRHKK
jgi:hypothetical protein